MQIPEWTWLALVALAAWGSIGLFQKMSTNYLSSESAFLWMVVGYVLFLPVVYTRESLLSLHPISLFWGLLGGILNALASWSLLAAMRHGGKASVVGPFTAMYPVVVVALSPLVLGETISSLQVGGVVCAVASVVLLSR